MYLKKMKTLIQKDTCNAMFRTELFIIAKIWKQPKCLSIGVWIKKLWYIETMEHYSAIKMRKSVIFNNMDGP